MANLSKLERYVAFQSTTLKLQIELLTRDYFNEVIGNCNRLHLFEIENAKRNCLVELYYLEKGHYNKIIGFQNSLNNFETFPQNSDGTA